MISCKKYPFKTRREARAASKLRTEMPFGSPYHCKVCGYWHLGHKNKIPKKTPLGRIFRKQRIERRHVRRLFQAIDEIFGV